MSQQKRLQYLVLESRHHRLFGSIVFGILMLFGAGQRTVSAQTGNEFDWRAHLNCPSEHQVRDDIQYCTGTDRSGHIVHVIVVDLQSPTVRFEYLLPEGYSDGHTGEQECRDPNVPAWAGPAGGCFVRGDRSHYPRMTLEQAVTRAGEVRPNMDVAAVINADYGAPDATHGPEGILVVRSARLDGADKCDDDFNAALRPWLGLGETLDPASGLLPVQIDRLPRDSAPLPSWIYTGVGGGPWLVREGEVYNGAATCQGEITLQQLESITNCTGNPKTTPLSESEEYLGGACRPAPHTAAGISANQRWLFLAMSTGNDTPDVLAHFMLTTLGVMDALKFDGGGSSQMWFAGEKPLPIDAGGENRRLTNFLAVYAQRGQGLALPLASTPVDSVNYFILNEGESFELDPTFRNDGHLTWKAEDGVALVQKAAVSSVFGRDVIYDLPHNVAPGETVSWDLTPDSGGVKILRFQMAQDGEFFGAETQFLIVVIPEALQEQREEIERRIEQFIEEAQAEGEQQLEELSRRVQEWLIQEAQDALEGAANTICNGLALVLLLPAAAIVLQHRQNGRANNKRSAERIEPRE